MRHLFNKRPAMAATAAMLAAIAALAPALFFANVHVAKAQSEQQKLPARCFAQGDTVHVVFGPESFFLPKTQQGPTSFKENAGPTIVTYPLYQGSSQGRKVYYVITDASDLSVARVLGVNYTPKLAKAAGTAAVQNSSSEIGTGHGIDFPASVDFSPQHILVPGPTGFPPVQAQPGAIGEQGYSPLVQVNFRGTNVILNAPQIANATGQADKVVSIDFVGKQVNYHETDGCYDNESVHYASFDASDYGAAAIEDVTYAPALNAAPSAGCADGAIATQPCSREPLIAFTNGKTGANNPERQGLNAAILDGIPPLNILKEIPEPTSQFDYSPMWDIHFETWTAGAVAAGINNRQTDFSTALAQVNLGNATGFGTPQVVPQNFVVNCPVISIDVNPNG